MEGEDRQCGSRCHKSHTTKSVQTKHVISIFWHSQHVTSYKTISPANTKALFCGFVSELHGMISQINRGIHDGIYHKQMRTVRNSKIMLCSVWDFTVLSPQGEMQPHPMKTIMQLCLCLNTLESRHHTAGVLFNVVSSGFIATAGTTSKPHPD